ncbi:hypothetical protein [Hafnia phage TS33]|nr:hypothetical protein [Hafnia phage TS33]
MTSREQFEVWFKANFANSPICIIQQVVRSTMFSAWQASRNSLEIKLPPAINTEEIGVAISKERTMARLAFAGIKVKGE